METFSIFYVILSLVGIIATGALLFAAAKFFKANPITNIDVWAKDLAYKHKPTTLTFLTLGTLFFEALNLTMMDSSTKEGNVLSPLIFHLVIVIFAGTCSLSVAKEMQEALSQTNDRFSLAWLGEWAQAIIYLIVTLTSPFLFVLVSFKYTGLLVFKVDGYIIPDVKLNIRPLNDNEFRSFLMFFFHITFVTLTTVTNLLKKVGSTSSRTSRPVARTTTSSSSSTSASSASATPP